MIYASFLQKKTVIIAYVTLLSGCTLNPVVIDDGFLYLGAFKAEIQEDKNCKYSDIEGLGLKVGYSKLGFGIGYFDRKMLSVKILGNTHCSGEIADVYLNLAAEEQLNTY